jgi:serine/threonine protein kinase/tetratricopeptide (TPR) repeat protein
MPRIGPQRWQLLSPYLDRALDLPDDRERASWLASLHEQSPDVAADLEALLREHRALQQQPFLESSVPLVPLDGAAGMSIGAYTLVSPIGRGGMGTVWLAERSDGRFERRVAVKLLNRSVGGGQERFRREGRILARLAHRHIAQLLDAGMSPSGQPYLVLEHVDGGPIDRYCDAQRLDVHARLRLFLDVLDAVAHAHASLIVHRDLKPSNVLVTAEGRVKLLDFGIAKLLEDEESGAVSITSDGASALTPAYAAPEQITGQPVSTATDVYALGVLLYVLLTGRHPAGSRMNSAAELVHWIVDVEPSRPSEVVARSSTPGEPPETAAACRATSPDRLRRLLRGDIDTIVTTALKRQPAERYASVAAFAEDLRRYLRHEPISARPDSMGYRGRRFLRRNRIAVAAVLAIVASLSIGLYAANRQRLIAERRFALVRDVANSLFDIDGAVRVLPGGVAARQLIVDTSLNYLARLADDARADPELALEVGTAYMRVARVQGVPISSNLGQLEQAERTLQAGKRLIDAVIAVRPDDRVAFLREAQIAHDRMILAGLRRPDDEALPLALEAAGWLDRYFATGSVATTDALQVVITLNNVGNRLRIEGRFDEAVRLTERGVGIATGKPDLARQLGGLWIGLGRIHRDRGALDDALDATANAVKVLDPAAVAEGPAKAWPYTFALALAEHGAILGLPGGVSLGRPTAAVVHLQRAFTIADEAAHRDPHDAQSRGLVSTAGRMLADLLRDSNPEQALGVYDHLLRHLGEIANNSRFRRDEVRAFSASASVLQRLARRREAGQRLDAAFSRLRELKLYPDARIDVGSEVQDALIARGDYEASAGDVSRATDTCEQLLQGVSAAPPRAESRLGEAAELSHLYASVAAIQRRTGLPDRAGALDARRLELWQHWDRKLPGNPFVAAQLQAARGSGVP